MNRLGIVGDIHAEDWALRAALDHLKSLDVDTIVAVGDIVDGQGSVDACCDLLQQNGVVSVRGNHERWFLRGELRNLPHATLEADVRPTTRAFLASLPASLRLATGDKDILVCHGLGEEDMATVRPDDFGYALEVNDPLQALMRSRDIELVVCGHSHRRMVRRFGSVTVVNAGTLTRDHDPCFGMIDLESRAVTFYEAAGEDIVAVQIVPLS